MGDFSEVGIVAHVLAIQVAIQAKLKKNRAISPLSPGGFAVDLLWKLSLQPKN
jgi:hypothetical protein